MTMRIGSCLIWRRSLAFLAVLFLSFLLGGIHGFVFCQERPSEEGETTGDSADQQTDRSQKRKFTNSDLRRYPTSDSGQSQHSPAETPATESPDGIRSNDPEGVEPGSDQETSEAEADPWDDIGVPTDSQGQGEEYWRQTMNDARGQLSAAINTRDSLQTEMNRLQNDFYSRDDPAVRGQIDAQIQEHFGLLEDADRAIAEAEQQLRDLEEEARRSGALPGWLR